MTTIRATTPVIDFPQWAILERSLIDLMDRSLDPLLDRYVCADGSLMWPTTDDHVGIDALDDAYESFHNWPLVYALGGGERLGAEALRLFDSITRQFARYPTGHGHSMIAKEYEQSHDWMHQGEGYEMFYLLGLVDPANETNAARARRYAGFFMGEDPEAPNWDPDRRMLRSPHVGSMGPGFRNFDRYYQRYRYEQWKIWPLPYHDVAGIRSVEDLRDPQNERAMGRAVIERMSRGDCAANLASTSLVTNAFLYTGDERCRHWVLDYVDAWIDRAKVNGGLVPDNVGPNGRIGECIDGKWYGGYYGWSWPHGWHTMGEAVFAAAENATLLSGDLSYIDFARRQLIELAERGREENGTLRVPHFHHDGGWDGYSPMHCRYLAHLWCASMKAEDREFALRMRDHDGRDHDHVHSHFSKHGGNHEAPWMAYLFGEYPDYPTDILRHNHAQVGQRLAYMADDTEDPAAYDDWYLQVRNPIFAEGLTQLTTGGPLFLYNGGLQHSRLRYFDADRRRPGLPRDVAARVDSLSDEEVHVQLVNTHPTETRRLVVQGGTFGEHTFSTVGYTARRKDGEPHHSWNEAEYRAWVASQTRLETTDVNDRSFAVELAPASWVSLRAGMRRFSARPGFAQSW